jgi:hypothetical protein
LWLLPNHRAFPASFIETSGLLRFSFHLQLRGSAGLAPASFSDGILPHRLLPYFKSFLESASPTSLEGEGNL